MENNVIILINKTPAFTEIWHQGEVKYNEEIYSFWLINPQDCDPYGHDYECEIRWFFKGVPREVRALGNKIIEAFKQNKYDSLQTL